MNHLNVKIMAKKKNISLSEGVGKGALKDGGEVLARVSSGKKYAELYVQAFVFAGGNW